jgi:pre-mRNA-processing factor 6
VCGFWLVSSLLFDLFNYLLLHFFSNREARENAELAKHRAERPKIQQQFADLKRGLSTVTDEEWETIPEVGNLTRKKRQKLDRSFAVPDSVIVGDRSKNEYENALDARQQEVCSISRVRYLMC